VLKHSDRYNFVIVPSQQAVVSQANRHWQTFAALASKLRLLLRYGHTVDLDPKMTSCICCKTAPAAADIQKPLARQQLKLSADHLALILLRLR
jgi:hypothetical protein